MGMSILELVQRHRIDQLRARREAAIGKVPISSRVPVTMTPGTPGLTLSPVVVIWRRFVCRSHSTIHTQPSTNPPHSMGGTPRRVGFEQGMRQAGGGGYLLGGYRHQHRPKG